MESKQKVCPKCYGIAFSLGQNKLCKNCDGTGYVSSPTPQVQSGLSAEEILNKRTEVFSSSHSKYTKTDILSAMEEYATSKVAERDQEIDRLNIEKRTLNGLNTDYLKKVAEKEREIIRLSGLLKEQHIKNVINIHQDKPEREWLANSSWSIYRELHNIQQPDKL